MASPLGKIQLPKKRKKNVRDPVLAIPEEIILRDGRHFNTKELLGQRTISTNYNLRNVNPALPLVRREPSKFSLPVKVWITQSDHIDIARHFGISLNYARALRSRMRNQLGATCKIVTS